MTNKFTTTHNNWDANLLIPFITPKMQTGNLYIDPIWGIKIENITIDEKTILANKYEDMIDDINFSKIAIDDSSFIYEVRRLDMIFASSFDEKDEFILEKYNFPENYQKMLIEYRIRLSVSTVSNLLVLESVVI